MTRCTCRRRIIDDPFQPFRMKIATAYRVIEDERGRLVVRSAEWKPVRDSREIVIALL